MSRATSNTDIRMLAVDLDGTLLGREGIDSRDVDALHQARDAGMEVVIATGRSWSESGHAIDRLALGGVMVGAGGAILQDVKSGKTLERFIVDEEVTRLIAAALLEDGHVVHLLQDRDETGFDYWMIGHGEVDAATEWWFKEHPLQAKWVESIDDVQSFDHTLRVGTVGAGSRLASRASELTAALGDRAHIQHWAAVVESAVTGSATHLLEAFHPMADKWTMLKRLAHARGLAHHQIAAIGDGLNDVSMLRGAGIGFAIEGAAGNVVAAANRRTGPRGRGVAEAVASLLSSANVKVVRGHE